MNHEDFDKSLKESLEFFPGVEIKEKQKLCLQKLLIERKDVLAILPTGYGKSLVYQLLPKILSNSWFRKTGEKKIFKILVISPLELIRKQQTERLVQHNIKAASLENFASPNDVSDDLEIIFGSAESWLKWGSHIKSGSIKNAEFLVVDEVHTVETWGTGSKRKAAFRQAFAQVKDLRSFLGEKPVLALTATADKEMRQRLCKVLGFKHFEEILISPNKHNIRFSVIPADKELKCFNWLVNILKSKKETSPWTIIFCHTVNDIVLILTLLLTKLGTDAYLDGEGPLPQRCLLAVYYSATPEGLKSRVASSFNGKGCARVVVASTSLSMGVDFSDVKYVIHFGPGRSLCDHLQQAGRAGRNGEQAHDIVFYLGKHVGQCDKHIRHAIKSKDCARKLLLSHFTEEDICVEPMHNCCNRCHLNCKCQGEECVLPPFDFEKEVCDETKNFSDQHRDITEADRQCLREALIEVRDSLAASAGVTMFNSSSVIANGFSTDVIDSVVENADTIFTISDLFECGVTPNISSIILEVLNEMFEDMEI